MQLTFEVTPVGNIFVKWLQGIASFGNPCHIVLAFHHGGGGGAHPGAPYPEL